MKFEKVPAKPKSAAPSTATTKSTSTNTRCTTNATFVV